MQVIRKNRGLTAQDVSDAIGYSKSQILGVENGIANPSYQLVLALEDFYGRSHRWLFEIVGVD